MGGPARCILALEDGTVFIGDAFGAEGTRTGEVVFNTSMCGYQEILTDPSYCGQIVTMTSSQIGNYGVTPEDEESHGPVATGFVVRELAERYSNQRATGGLAAYMRKHGTVGIETIDTRALTRLLRVGGAMRGVITTEEADPARCVEIARSARSMIGADLVSEVAPTLIDEWTGALANEYGGASPAFSARRVIAIDCGMKRNILRHVVSRAGPVTVVPPTMSAGDILDMRPEGVLVSNGPGDPAAVRSTIETLRGLIGRVPVFGICLGHQLLGLALGAETFKLKFGHRGANQPVRNLASGCVEITSQNHGFAIEAKSLERCGGATTHVNLNDGTIEGFTHREMPLLAVQYHPEASPGPHDATYLFDCFATMMASGRPPTAAELAASHASSRRVPVAVPADRA